MSVTVDSTIIAQALGLARSCSRMARAARSDAQRQGVCETIADDEDMFTQALEALKRMEAKTNG